MISACERSWGNMLKSQACEKKKKNAWFLVFICFINWYLREKGFEILNPSFAHKRDHVS